MTMPLALYKPLKKHEQGTHAHSLPQKIVRVILVDFLLKLRNSVPGPPVWTSFCTRKKST